MNPAYHPIARRRSPLCLGLLGSLLITATTANASHQSIATLPNTTHPKTTTTAAQRQPNSERSLSFFHTHTGERLEIVYFRQGQYSEDALARINVFLRDFRTGDVASIDRRTLDIVHDLTQQLSFQGEVHIVSAYRSPKTNEMLRKKSKGVAKKSQHLEGKAIDFRFPGVDTAKLRDIAKTLQRGGVGYYDKSDFIHVDSGKVRYW